MDRTLVRKGAGVLALAAALVLAGAQPAAAEDSARVLGSVGLLSSLWGEIADRAAQVRDGIGDLIATWGAAAEEGTDCGFGVDPNGNALAGRIDAQPGEDL